LFYFFTFRIYTELYFAMNGRNDVSINPEVVNDRQVTTIQRTPVHVDTPSGAAWVRKYLHPPCATPDDYAGYPDTNNSPSTDAEYKGLNDIQTFTTSAGADPITLYYNKVLLLHTSSAIAPVIPFRVTTDGVINQIPTDILLNRNINVADMVAQNASGRISYKSTTSWLNATGFNNQGNVTTAQFRPNIAQWSVTDTLNCADKLSFRNRVHVYRALASFYDSKNEDDDFEVLDDDDPAPRGAEAIIAGYRKRLTFAVDNMVQVLQVGQVPTDPSQILMMSPNAVAASAKEGSFVVQRFSQPDIMYKDFAQNGVKNGGVYAPIGMPCFIYSPSTGAGTLNAISIANQPGNATKILADLPWFDFMWGWTLYEGLSVQPSGTAVTPPYISVKTITGFEFQPLPDSMLSPFIRNSAVYDLSAIRMATMANHAIADSLPASANFWGTVGKLLLQAAPSIVNTIVSLFGEKKRDPVASVTGQMRKMRVESATLTPREQRRAQAAPPAPLRAVAPTARLARDTPRSRAVVNMRARAVKSAVTGRPVPAPRATAYRMRRAR
jgi:hypothetical protein